MALITTHGFRSERDYHMASDAEIDAAVKAMRSVRTKGAKIHEEVLRAYARAALEAAEVVQKEEYQERAETRRQQINTEPPTGRDL
jgi:hypothetical protein